MTGAPLIIGQSERRALDELREAAGLAPVDVVDLLERIKTARGDRSHRRRMTRQTVRIPGPWPFFVTFSVETGHPAGTCRHMSMSVRREDRVPNAQALWMIAEMLGFSGGLEACRIWPEALSDGGTAMNVVQPVAVAGAVVA